MFKPFPLLFPVHNNNTSHSLYNLSILYPNTKTLNANMKQPKQNKSKKPDNNVVGKGNVTPVQVAFIVDRYLSDNNFTQTRSTFRSEVSNLLSVSTVQKAPKGLLSLSAILDEYIRLKEQRVFMDQERVVLEQEKTRVQNLLKGMQSVMNDYNQSTAVSCLPPALPSAGGVESHVDLAASSSREGHYPMYNSSVMKSTSHAWAAHTDGAQFSTPVTNKPKIAKRKGSSEFDASTIAKRSRKSTKTNQLPIQGGVEVSTLNGSASKQSIIGHGNTSIVPSPQGSTVVKRLFNQTTPSPPANSCPKTPPRSSSTQTEKAMSPAVIFPSVTSYEDMSCQQITTNSTTISSQTIRISPVKQISYCTIERNHSISISSPSKRNHVKGRLNFDASDIPTSSLKPICDVSTPESDGGANILDLDLPSLEDFNLSDLLFDFDLQNDGSDYSAQLTGESSPDSHSGSPYTALGDSYGANPAQSHISMVKELYSEDTDMPAPGCVTTFKSMTKCIKMLSPVKRQMNGSPQRA